MTEAIRVALIQASGTVLAAVIGVAGVSYILKHRRRVKRLAKEVVAYYYHEEQLVREIHRLRGTGESELSDRQLSAVKGQLRAELETDKGRPSMSARSAQQLAGRVLDD